MRLLLHWDPEIDGAFRRAFEGALAELRIAHDDASSVDETPKGAVNIALASPASAREKPRDAILIVGGPGEAKADGALRLEAKDIAEGSRRWDGVVEKLGAALDRRAIVPFVQARGDVDTLKRWALEHPADPLAETVGADFDIAELRRRLGAERARADAAEAKLRDHERWLADTQREARHAEGDAVGAAREAQIEAAQLRASLGAAEERLRDLSSTLEATAFGLARAPEAMRGVIADARREAGLARIAADRAEAIAREAPDALRWDGALYRGETLNGLPHGLGVMSFVVGRKETGGYRGEFEGGRRVGLGIGWSEGFRWSGHWTGDEAGGLGVLETDDGRRFEGEVAMVQGSPRRVRGHLWPKESAQVLRHAPSPAGKMLPGPKS
jgi:hypothetical protein